MMSLYKHFKNLIILVNGTVELIGIKNCNTVDGNLQQWCERVEEEH